MKALRDRVVPRAEEQVVVAWQGERGAYGHLVVERIWGSRASELPCRTFAEAIAAVQGGAAHYAVLPLHNEIIGEIPGVRTALQDSGLIAVGEVRQPVRHCLLAPHGSLLSEISAAYSHPVALAQCTVFLQRHPAIVPHQTYDTAGAAREVAARGRHHEAAIASEGCAAMYGLHIVARDIGDRPDNATTFAVVQRPD